MELLTMAQLKAFKPGEVFATGTVLNNPDGIYMTDTDLNRPMLWVAKRGAVDDWAIYIHWQDMGQAYVISNGDKVRSTKNIINLVPCDVDALAAYRF